MRSRARQSRRPPPHRSTSARFDSTNGNANAPSPSRGREEPFTPPLGSGDGAVGQTVPRRDERWGWAKKRTMTPEPPEWVITSPLLSEAFSLAAAAHQADRRPSDGRFFLEHVTEVAGLLQQVAFDEELVAVGLLHDSVERGRLTEPDLRESMGDSICDLVMILSEDPAIESFEERKAALREQIASAGRRAVTVFAADKLSDIAGLRRAIEASRDNAEAGMGTDVASIAAHYRDSVQMIASVQPGSAFLSALQREVGQLETVS
jgi:guanosine-3',5'-bis(diphosphate) 3'-pyrophosphohydrolase